MIQSDLWNCICYDIYLLSSEINVCAIGMSETNERSTTRRITKYFDQNLATKFFPSYCNTEHFLKKLQLCLKPPMKREIFTVVITAFPRYFKHDFQIPQFFFQ